MEDRYSKRGPGSPGSEGAAGDEDRGGGSLRAPVRTCVVCRAKRPQSSLVRVRQGWDGLAVGLAQGRGRSAYCCFAAECRRQLGEKGRLERALRRQIPGAEKARVLTEVTNWQN
ncbi:MAG: DUF448 domain-containing protein [Fimbriimonadaceae bacterium]|nr:DUF448 domain-containing protein [Fimbriimonadaceae bacterium]QYK55032.1 MAG: DUF448 domain-containing protein [Fimbriimonadaceae bacterium]